MVVEENFAIHFDWPHVPIHNTSVLIYDLEAALRRPSTQGVILLLTQSRSEALTVVGDHPLATIELIVVDLNVYLA